MFFAAAIAALALVGCKKAEVGYVADTQRPVLFSVENGLNVAYTVKAEAIETAGEEVGIFAGAPIGKTNEKYTVAAGNTLTGAAMYWGIGQTEATTFTAMYPYDAKVTSTEIEYDITDQAHAAKFLRASTSVAPGTVESPNKVAFSFTHPFAKLVVDIDATALTQDNVQEAKLKGVSMGGKLDLTANTVSNLADATDLDLKPTGQTEFIIMPQTVNPQIEITTFGGRTFIFKLDEPHQFKAGEKATANVVVSGSTSDVIGDDDRSSVSVAAFTVADWTPEETVITPDKDATTSTEVSEWWYLLGTVNSSCWNNLYALSATGENTMSITFNYTPDSKVNESDKGFQFVKMTIGEKPDGTWSNVKARAGAGTVKLYVEGDNTSYSVLNGTNNIVLTDAGNYTIDFYTDNNNAKIVKNN